MASQRPALFQALLLASALGWSPGVFAREERAYGNGPNNNTTSSAPAQQTANAPIVGVSQVSLIVPTTTTTSFEYHLTPLIPVLAHSDTVLEGPPLTSTGPPRPPPPSPVLQHSAETLVEPTTSPRMPAMGHTQSSLGVPTTRSTAPTVYPSPVRGHEESSLEVPGQSTTTTTQAVPQSPVRGHSQSSLEVPGEATTTTKPTLYPSPVRGHSQSSLIVPGETSTPPILYSPVRGHSQPSLIVPGTTTGPSTTLVVAPMPVTEKSESELLQPTRRPHHGGDQPGHDEGDEHAGEGSPHDHHDGGSGSGHSAGQPGGDEGEHSGDESPHGQHDGESGHQGGPNPGGIIASLAHEHGQEWGAQTTAAPSQHSGHGQTHEEGRPTSTPGHGVHAAAHPTPGSTYHLMGTQIVAGASAATIDGTTYSLAPQGDGIYVDGQRTAFTSPAATDSVAMALMSALGGDAPTTRESGRGSTLATGTSRSQGGGSSVAATTSSSTSGATSSTASSADTSGTAVKPADDNAGAVVLPGLALGGGVGLVMALL